MICNESDEFPGLFRIDKIANYNTFLHLKQVIMTIWYSG